MTSATAGTLRLPRPAPSDCTASLTDIGDLGVLERDWRALESRVDAGFFRSWDWMGPFLEFAQSGDLPRVLRVRDPAGEIVGLGLLWAAVHRRHGFVRSRTLHLNETGDPRFDALTMEHNGLLAAPGMDAAVTAAAVRQLSTLRAWDEVGLGGLGASADHAWREAAQAQGWRYRTRWEKPYYFIDLAKVRAAGGGYLDALSANTRYQLRRAMRLQAARGPLLFEQAGSVEQALAWLGELATLHQKYWTARGAAGAFATTFAVRFHEAVVARGWSSGRVEISRVRAGDDVLGYLYNFAHDGVVYNYQAGHVTDDDSKLKPGLVCHCLAVEDALSRGHLVYDLLMGGGHYKSSLVNDSGTMTWATLQRPRLSLQLEEMLRRGRDRLRPPAGVADHPKPNA